MESLIKPFKSVKLAIVLIFIIITISILAPLVSQGKELSFYYDNYHPLLSWLIINTQLNNLFYSIFFFVPLGLFFLNLLVCAIDRLSKGLKKTTKKDSGRTSYIWGFYYLL